MDVSGEIVINDLLSFLFCNRNDYPQDFLLQTIRKFYGDTVVSEAKNILFKAIPIKDSTKSARSVASENELVAIYKCLQLLPETEMPYFVCIDLNNVPTLKGFNTDNVNNTTKEEIEMKLPVKDITDNSNKNLGENNPIDDKPDDNMELESSDDNSESSAMDSSNSEDEYDFYEIEYCGEEEEVIDLEENHADILYQQCLSEEGPQVQNQHTETTHKEDVSEIHEEIGPEFDANIQIKQETDVDMNTEDIELPAVSLANNSEYEEFLLKDSTENNSTSSSWDKNPSADIENCTDLSLRIESVTAVGDTELSQFNGSDELGKNLIVDPVETKPIRSHKRKRTKKYLNTLIQMEQLSKGPLQMQQLSVLQAIYCPLCAFNTDSKHIMVEHMKKHV